MQSLIEAIIRVVIYVRVSTLEQVEGYSIDMQLERLRAYCKSRGWIIADEIVDPGESGSSLNRPGIQQIINNISKYDIVLVYKLDRLSRSQKDTLYLIEEVFLPNGVDFVSHSESFDTSTSYGRAMIGILSVFAQLEREQIKERTQSGRLERAKEGLFHGGGAAPYGYFYRDGRLVINEIESRKVTRAYELYLAGYGFNKIAHLLGFSYGNQIRRMLYNDVYIGNVTFKGETFEGQHESIIDRETWDKVQERLKRKGGNKKSFRSEYMLTGLVYCGNCGARYSVRTRNRKDNKYYTCYSRNKHAMTMIKDPNCKNPNWNKEQLEAYIDHEVRNLLFDPDAFDELIGQDKEDVPEVDERALLLERIGEIDRQIKKTMELYRMDKIPQELVADEIGTLHAQRQELQAAMEQVSSTKEESADREEMRALLADTAGLWNDATDEEKRELLAMMVKRIVIRPDGVPEIEWMFT